MAQPPEASQERRGRGASTDIHSLHPDIKHHKGPDIGRAAIDHHIVWDLDAPRPAGAVPPAPVLRLVVPHSDASPLGRRLRGVVVGVLHQPVRRWCGHWRGRHGRGRRVGLPRPVVFAVADPIVGRRRRRLRGGRARVGFSRGLREAGARGRVLLGRGFHATRNLEVQRARTLLSSRCNLCRKPTRRWHSYDVIVRGGRARGCGLRGLRYIMAAMVGRGRVTVVGWAAVVKLRVRDVLVVQGPKRPSCDAWLASILGGQ